MQEQTIKKGTIQKIDNEYITLFNHDGQCEDTYPIYAQFADEIRSNIQPGKAVFYVVESDQLLGIGLEESAPADLKMLYEMMPKDRECSFWMNREEARA